MVAGYEADATWVDERIVIELDSWEYHHTRVDFETDRDRDVDRLAAGFLTVRLTWERMFSSSIREARRLHEVIATWGQPGLSGSASAPAPARRARTARNRAA
jgi:very-short-patch-repair endonuclease